MLGARACAGLEPARPVLVRGSDEGREQRMRFERLGFELWMELAAQKPGMVRNLADFHVNGVGSLAGDPQPSARQNLFVLPVELVTMPMTFADLRRSVSAFGEASRCEQAGIRSQPHGST